MTAVPLWMKPPEEAEEQSSNEPTDKEMGISEARALGIEVR